MAELNHSNDTTADLMIWFPAIDLQAGKTWEIALDQIAELFIPNHR